MPIVKKIKHNSGIIGIWKLSETVNDLVSIFHFSENEKDYFSNIKAESRKKEFMAVRLLLENILNKKTEINYLKSGKPILSSNDFNISITHSEELVVVFVSNNKIGIDVERTNRRIEKIASRFLHPSEHEFIRSLDNPQKATILYWSAKEAIFKCTDHSGILFDKEIRILPFDIKDAGNFNGILVYEKTQAHYYLCYFFYENNVIVSCVEKK